MTTKLLMVCLGNICRSPAAEGVMKKIINNNGASTKYFVDSAGTSGYHSGEKADSRMRKVGISRGYTFDSISRQIRRKDYEEFDYIFAMDDSNYRNMLNYCPRNLQYKIHKMCEFSKNINASEVPDPYYGGDKGFHRVIDILEDACQNLFEQLENGTIDSN